MLDQTRLAPKYRHWNLIFQQVFKHWTQCNPPKTEQLDPYNGARDDAGELFWSRPNSSKSQGLFKKVQSVNQKKGSLIAFKKTAQCPTFLIYNMFIPPKKWWGNRCFLPAATFKPNGPKKGCKVTKPMWISEIRRLSRRGVLTNPFRPGVSAYFFSGVKLLFFFRVVPLNERKLTLEKSTVICGRMFLLLFFLWDFDGCVFFGWMFPWFFFMPVQNGTWNFPCGVFVGRSKLLCKNDMIWVGGIVLLRGHKDFGWSLFLGEGYSRMQHRGSFHWPKVVLESLKTNSSPQKTGAATYFQWLC